MSEWMNDAEVENDSKPTEDKIKKWKEDLIEQLERIGEKWPTLNRYSRNLTLLAGEGKLSNCYFREKEIEDIQVATLRQTKPNVLLVGPSGCGKTAIVEGLAQLYFQELLKRYTEDCGLTPAYRLISEKLPLIFELELGSLLAGTRYRGDFEERLDAIIKEIKHKNRKVILFIDEAHLLADAGNAEGAVSAANFLKPSLARGELVLIAATTKDEYKEHLLKDKALLRRFSKVDINQISKKNRSEGARLILKDYSDKFSIPCDETITDTYLESLFISGPLEAKMFPCDFVDVIDTMFARAKYDSKDKVGKAELNQAISVTQGCLVV